MAKKPKIKAKDLKVMQELGQTVDEFIASLPDWQVASGDAYAGMDLSGHKVVVAMDAYSPARDRILYSAIYSSTDGKVLPEHVFKHWQRKYVSAILLPPGAPESVRIDTALAVNLSADDTEWDMKQLCKELEADADTQWKRLTQPERVALCAKHKVPGAASYHLPPLNPSTITDELSDMYEDHYRASFGSIF